MKSWLVEKVESSVESTFDIDENENETKSEDMRRILIVR